MLALTAFNAFAASIPLAQNPTFGPPLHELSVTQFADFAVGDVNQDSHLDVAAVGKVSAGNYAVDVALGVGGARFGAVLSLPLPHPPRIVELADVDGDTRLDLLVLTGLSNGLAVARNLGAGTFAPPSWTALSFTPNSLAIGDLDQDGDADLFMGSDDANAAWIAYGAAGATFGAPGSIGMGSLPRDVQLADLDGDSRLDLVALANSALSPLVVFRRSLDGRSFAFFTSSAAPAYSRSFTLFDADADGHLDAAMIVEPTAGGPASDVAILRGGPNGSFANPQSYPVGIVASNSPVRAADFDGDGVFELATFNLDMPTLSAGSLRVLRRRPDGSYAVEQHATQIGTCLGLEVADFDLNGRDDLLVAAGMLAEEPVSFAVLRTRANGDVSPWDEVATRVGVRGFGLGDFDVDGRTDIVVASVSAIEVFHRTSFDSYEPAQTIPATQVREAFTADFTGDARVDLLESGWNATSDGSEVRLHVGRSDGTFESVSLLVTTSWFQDSELADFDGDGEMDFATSWNSPAEIRIHRHLHGTNFAAPVVIPLAVTAYPIVAGDLVADGRPDLVARLQTGELALLRNLGDGTFAPPVVLPIASAGQPALADLDGDGYVDLVHSIGNDLAWRRGFGDGTLGRARLLSQQQSFAWRHFETDADGDGLLDVIVTRGFDAKLLLVRNLGAGQFAAPEPTLGGTAFWAVARDTDRDGQNDLVLATGWQDSDRVRILRQR